MRNIFLDEEAIEDDPTVSSADDCPASIESNKALFDFRDDLSSTASFESPELHRLIDRNIALMTGEISDDDEEDDDDDAAEDLKDFIVSDNEELECEQSATEEDTDASSSCAPRRLHRPEYKPLCPGCARKGAIRARLAVFQAVALQLAPAPNLPAYQIYRNLRPLPTAKSPRPASDSPECTGPGPTEPNEKGPATEKAPIEKASPEHAIVRKAAADSAVRDKPLKEKAMQEKVPPAKLSREKTVKKLPVATKKMSKLPINRDSQQGLAKLQKKKKKTHPEASEVLDYSELMQIAGRQSLAVTLPDGFGGDFEIIPSEQYPSLEEEGEHEVTNVVYVRGSSRARGMEDYLVVFSSSSQSVAAPIKFGSETAEVSSRKIVTKISMIPIREIDKALRILLKSKTLKASTEEEPSVTLPAVTKRPMAALPHPISKCKRQRIDSQKVIALATKKLRREHRWASRSGRRLRLIKRITQHHNAPLMAAARHAGYTYIHGPPLGALPASIPPLPNPTFPSQKLLKRLLQKPLLATKFSQI
eukprot:Protomagalhaensia_wolfi_Nauph_80__34@NODE_101_length_3715_cov_101_659412_g76_i0_p1_GENE_NODE_101_length_3715_cov_101_659412_g76_i0NODE_101_length_3715_cov_101_659412_g76_i0_p1_ORF_typecomplete_len533_score93_83HC2/PF07382_11/0_0074SPT6_acidic/PF14632_6/0_021SPT6_acidic/PF14632_6/8e02Spt5_N/PF11942_8/0_68_NODE_101_length_3715_cov_101_659412_g76_i04292027